MSITGIEENDQTRARHEHLEALRQLVGNVYPNKFVRSHVVAAGREDTITAIVEKFRTLEPAAPKVPEGARPAAEEIELANQQLNKITVRLAGRIASPPRVMGKAAFVHLSDGSSRLQTYARKADVKAINNDTGALLEEEGKGWELFGLLDHGDFIGVEGFLFVTKTGELSVHVQKLQFLAKALLPLPDKMHGINDPEIRQRQRYADLIAGSLKLERAEGELTPREVFERRSAVIRELRRFLEEHGYIEVETPMLTPLATGAAAKPFKTHHNALDIDLFARIAPELYLKRLLVGGFEKVYELNRNFRNEGISSTHNPEFTMLEFYWAYADVNQMMDFCEEMMRASVVKVVGNGSVRFLERRVDHLEMKDGKSQIAYEDLDHKIDFGSRFERLSMKEAIVKHWPSELRMLDGDRFEARWLETLPRLRTLNQLTTQWLGDKRLSNKVWHQAHANEQWRSFKQVYESGEPQNPLDVPEEVERAHCIVAIFGNVAEQQLIQPTFITGFPKPVSPLSKASPTDSSVAERFELYIAGMECANGFSELNDPAEQYQRFNDQVQQRERGDEEAMVMDEDYIRALSYGMPPAAGIGIGIDRFVMLLTNRQSIRDVILFPHLRPERRREEPESEPPAVEPV